MKRSLFANCAAHAAGRGTRPPRKECTALAAHNLSDHLRRDIGIDDQHSRERRHWSDPLEVEIRRLRNRL